MKAAVIRLWLLIPPLWLAVVMQQHYLPSCPLLLPVILLNAAGIVAYSIWLLYRLWWRKNN